MSKLVRFSLSEIAKSAFKVALPVFITGVFATSAAAVNMSTAKNGVEENKAPTGKGTTNAFMQACQQATGGVGTLKLPNGKVVQIDCTSPDGGDGFSQFSRNVALSTTPPTTVSDGSKVISPVQKGDPASLAKRTVVQKAYQQLAN